MTLLVAALVPVVLAAIARDAFFLAVGEAAVVCFFAAVTIVRRHLEGTNEALYTLTTTVRATSLWMVSHHGGKQRAVWLDLHTRLMTILDDNVLREEKVTEEEAAEAASFSALLKADEGKLRSTNEEGVPFDLVVWRHDGRNSAWGNLKEPNADLPGWKLARWLDARAKRK